MWENIPNEAELEKWHGFVYRITRLNALPGEKSFYIGCKKLKSRRTLPPLKGAKRKRKIIKKSDYETYYGSSKELLLDIAVHGKDNFKREVLKLCSCQWELKYQELLWQIKENVLLDHTAYNGIVNLRIGKIPKQLYDDYAVSFRTIA